MNMTTSVTDQIHAIQTKLELADRQAHRLREILRSDHHYFVDGVMLPEFHDAFDAAIQSRLNDLIVKADGYRQQLKSIRGK